MQLRYLLEPAVCSCFESSDSPNLPQKPQARRLGSGALEHLCGVASPEEIPDGWQSGKGES